MMTIDIEYRRFGIRRRVRGFAPSRWVEMCERQYMAAVRALLGIIGEDEYMAEMFGISRRLVHRLDDWHRYILRKQLRLLDNGRAESSRLFIARVEGLHAPSNMLGGMSLQQYMTVDTFFEKYAVSVTSESPMGDIPSLCRMVAALYLRPCERYFLPDNPPAGERLVDIDANARRLNRRASRDVLWGIYLNWVMVRNWMSLAYPLLFPTGDDGNEGARSPIRVRNRWLQTFDAFMGDDAAHIEQYRRMACTDAFRIMNGRIKNNLTRKNRK